MWFRTTPAPESVQGRVAPFWEGWSILVDYHWASPQWDGDTALEGKCPSFRDRWPQGNQPDRCRLCTCNQFCLSPSLDDGFLMMIKMVLRKQSFLYSNYNSQNSISSSDTSLGSASDISLSQDLLPPLGQPPLLPTAYVVRGKVMFWHVSVCRSFCLSTPGGGYLCQVQLGGYPDGGYPTLSTPCQTWWGYPDWGVPHLGYPPICWTWQEVPQWGVPHLRNPPHWTWPGIPQLGGTPPWVPPIPPVRPGWGVPWWGSTPPRVVLDTPQSVCLLRSRRRTFLSWNEFSRYSLEAWISSFIIQQYRLISK